MSRNIVIIILLVFIVLFTVFLWRPEYDMFSRLNTELGMKLAQMDPENMYYAQVKSSYDYLSDNKDKLQKVDDALPEDMETSRIIYFLQQKALQNGLEIKNVVLSKSTVKSQNQTNGSIKDIVVSVSISGSYESLSKFIFDLEKSDRIFEVTNISFASPSPITQVINGVVRTI